MSPVCSPGVLCGNVSPRWRRIRKKASRLVYGLYDRRLMQQAAGRHPRHVGVVLDGNRRWAREAGFTDVVDGHRAGARRILDLLSWCRESDVELVTLWLLSTDNVTRPQEELAPLLEVISDVVEELAGEGNAWRLRIIGALDILPEETSARLSSAAQRTLGRTGMEVNIAVGYGGRREIADAVRKLLQQHAEKGSTIEELVEVLDVDHIAEHLYTSGQPDPDLVIRTSGEQRLSGFLLWQSAHSEFWFCEAYWPDFRRTDFLRALRDYAIRHRRFGS
ncbi:isoprenyl transferase [Actinophytocola xanthii]|uniref:Isoprenyl transferase n=1 Tax=Actinophytocola xanthii TaxID=1912961 RepID=A0A1Q8C3I9_9PSEU|nr:isoprenyl transferase [Actinophytocola xanthii]